MTGEEPFKDTDPPPQQDAFSALIEMMSVSALGYLAT